jgi:hypothetical protein
MKIKKEDLHTEQILPRNGGGATRVTIIPAQEFTYQSHIPTEQPQM